MKTVTLNILAEDIKTTNYSNSSECAITRALNRAGIEAHECGFGIKTKEGKELAKTPAPLLAKVMAMYGCKSYYPTQNSQKESLEPIEPQDFSFELELDID